MARVDTVVSVALNVDNERDDPKKYHPTKWLARASNVRLMVGAAGYDTPMCALTCPGRDAPDALKQLMDHLAELTRKHASSSDTVYLHAMYMDWPSRRPDRIWSLTTTIPEPEWIRR